MTTIRSATSDDVPAIRALMPDRAIDPRTLSTVPGQRYALVLDDDDGRLAAAALVTIEHGCGHVDALAVAEAHEGEGLIARMLGVVESICAAFGAEVVEVRSNS